MHRLYWSLALICALLLSLAPVHRSQAAATSAQLTVKATIAGAASDANVGGSKLNGFMLIGMAKTGRVVFSKKLTAATNVLNQKSSAITLVGGKIPAGISFHLIDKDGDYYGPLIIGWSNKTRITSTKVSSTLTALTPAQATLNFGAITVKTKSKGQGYAYTSAKYALAATSSVSASAGVPKGIGTYGKASSPRLASRAGATAADFLDGADADLDGIINAFDVSDDGDTIPDYADTAGMLTPPNTGDLCESAASFSLFSNFKATQPDYSGTINAYAEGTSFVASKTSTAAALTATLSFAIQRISVVCGSNVTKIEFKGVNVPYAPTDYVELPSSGSDVQWTVGDGKMNNATVTGLSAYTFTCDPTCEISGQDTFMQRVTTVDGKVFEFVTSPTFVFITHPMLLTYKTTTDVTSTACDGTGYDTNMNSYDGTTMHGTQDRRILINSAADQTLCLKIFRPQRLAIEGEPTTASVGYYDLGSLEYYPDIPNPIGSLSGSPGRCDTAKVTDTAGDTLGTPTGTLASNPTYTIAWKISDIKACFLARSATWGVGTLTIDIQAVAPVANSGNAAQKLFLSIVPEP